MIDQQISHQSVSFLAGSLTVLLDKECFFLRADVVKNWESSSRRNIIVYSWYNSFVAFAYCLNKLLLIPSSCENSVN